MKVTSPNGEVREVESGTPVSDLVPDEAIAARVDGQLVDLSKQLTEDAAVEPVLISEPDGLHVLRHSTAHVMAQAVCDLYPGARYAIGPPIEDGFYYDFELPVSLTPENLEKIEERMRAIAAAGQPFVREELDREAALERFADQPFKQEIIEAAEAEEGALGETFSVYRNNGWADLCLGPHVPATSRLGAFKLLHLAGAYWRGDEKRPQLQRIYGTAWATQEDLDAHLHRLEEAERRDHRRLGRQLDLVVVPGGDRGRPGRVAPARRDVPQGDRGLCPRGPPAPRLRARVHAAPRAGGGVVDLGPPREVPGEHVPADAGGRGR